MVQQRLHRLRAALAELGVDSILVSQPENRYYLSGFDGSAGYLLITGADAVLATDFRYVEQSRRQAPLFTLFEIKGRMAEWFPALLGDRMIERLGFEASQVTFAFHRELAMILEQHCPGLSLAPLENAVERLRGVKDREEVELIQRAARMADSAFQSVTVALEPGVTELEVAWRLERHMREAGSGPMPFEVIVASGPNAALPHHRPSERRIAAGEPVVIDMGARFGNYCSDMTRTICLGGADEQFRKVYGVVRRAHEAAIGGIRVGMTGVEADEISRRIIREAGHGDLFGHGLGHGVGLATHDPFPRLNPLAPPEPLTNDMVFSIEPGIYIPGWGGVRIEDLAVMEGGKVRLLSGAPKWTEGA